MSTKGSNTCNFPPELRHLAQANQLFQGATLASVKPMSSHAPANLPMAGMSSGCWEFNKSTCSSDLFYTQPQVLPVQKPRVLPHLRSLLKLLCEFSDSSNVLLGCVSGSSVGQEGLDILKGRTEQFLASSPCSEATSPAVEAWANMVTVLDAAESVLDQSAPRPDPREPVAVALLSQLVRFHNFVHPDSTEPPQLKWAVHLSTLLISCVAAASSVQNADCLQVRASTIAVFLKNILCPSFPAEVQVDVHLLSVKGLTSLLTDGMRVPRSTLDIVIRPALLQLCSEDKLPRLALHHIAGLSSAVDLIPQLFNRAFAAKVISILHLFNTASHAFSRHPHRPEMMALMVSLFSSLTRCFPCDTYIVDLCEVATASLSTNQPVPLLEPLLRFLSQHPSAAADHVMQPPHQPLLSALLALPAGRASPLRREIAKRQALLLPSPPHPFSAFCLNPDFADLTFVVGRERTRVPGHRVVLMACPYFAKLLTAGMAESFENQINLPHVNPSGFVLALGHVYGLPLPDHLTAPQLVDLLHTADYLALDRLADECEQSLCSLVTDQDALPIAQSLPSLDLVDQQQRQDKDCAPSRGLRPLARACRAALVAKPAVLAHLNPNDHTTRTLLCADLVPLAL